MDITKNKAGDGSVLIMIIDGSIDTVTAPVLEQELKNSYSGIKELILDFANVDYISSAGLRIILSAEHQMSEQGSLTLKNVNEDVREVFEMTGFDELLNLE